jgi:hypothetical protein
MFWHKFRRTPKTALSPDLLKNLERVRKVVQSAPRGAAVDPEVVAQTTGLSTGPVIALLEMLGRSHEGRLELRVVDELGREIATFKRLEDIPESVEDDFGDVTRVYPENVELVFRTSQ